MTATDAGDADAKVRFLSSPDAYPDRPARVDVVETHLSFVFLAGERVFKLKKPVASEYFDFTTLAGREANCRNEVRLNRRLAGDLYQGVARLVLTAGRELAIDGSGETVDWLVVMRRLPEDRMLDRMIARGAICARELEQLSERLAAFYAGQPAAEIEGEAYLRRFTREQAINRAVLAACPGERPSRYDTLLDRLDAALAKQGALLVEQAQAGAIVDGHGDLKPEHVCMNEPIVIFDCLEFSDDLRQVDPVDELAYLGLECAMLGSAWIGPKLSALVLTRLGKPVREELSALYTASRAMLRARLSLAHLLDPAPRDPEKWGPLADRYANAADAALTRLGF